MTCPISPLTSSLFSLIRHSNLKATGNRSHVRLLVLYQCQLKCLKAARLISLIPKRMFICDHFPIVKLLCQLLIYKSDTYADICFGILQASWDSCLPALLVDLSFKLRALMDHHNGETLDLHGRKNSSHVPIGVYSNALFHREMLFLWDQTFCRFLPALMKFLPEEDSHA